MFKAAFRYPSKSFNLGNILFDYIVYRCELAQLDDDFSFKTVTDISDNVEWLVTRSDPIAFQCLVGQTLKRNESMVYKAI